MSIKIMTTVWDHSRHDGTPLNLLLCLADHADDDGLCWPGIRRLSERIRKSERHTKRLLRDLEDSGELYTQPGGGRGHANLYMITVGFSEKEIVDILQYEMKTSPAEARSSAAKIVAQRVPKGDIHDTETPDEDERVTSPAERVTSPAERVTSPTIKGDIAVSPEPLEPSREPPLTQAARAHVPSSPSPEDAARQRITAALLGSYDRVARDEWLNWGSSTRLISRWGDPAIPKDHVQQLGYILEHEFGLAPVWGDKGDADHWIKGLALLVGIAGTNFDAVRQVVRDMRANNLCIGGPHSLVNMLRSYIADRQTTTDPAATPEDPAARRFRLLREQREQQARTAN